MRDFIENAIKEELIKTTEGCMFYVKRLRNYKDIGELTGSVRELIAQYGLSASEAQGFLDYMKIIVSASSHIPCEKEKRDYSMEVGKSAF